MQVRHIGLGVLVALGVAVGAHAVPVSKPFATFQEVWHTVDERFYDPRFNGQDWQAIHRRYEAAARQAATLDELAPVINRMLAELKTSHTRFYTRNEPAYYQLLGGIFKGGPAWQAFRKRFPGQSLHYVEIGVFTATVEGHVLIQAVLDGGPAALAGLEPGDQILGVDGKGGFKPVGSFVGKAGQRIALQIRKPGQPEAERIVVPRRYDPQTMFLEAMRASARIIERGGARLGYVHVWSYAGEPYQQLLEETILHGPLKDANGLILDVRNGWGGASPEYLHLFTGKSPTLTLADRTGKRRDFSGRWQKPVVLLVDEDTRSGKEVLAHGFKKYQIGPVVGARTAGAVVAGSPFLMADGSLLYLAVADVAVDGERLEGRGVTPDVAVATAPGGDQQLQKAVEVLLDALQKRRERAESLPSPPS